MRTHLRAAVAALALTAATALPAHADDGNAATNVPDATVAIDAAFDAGLRGNALIDAATVAVNASGARPTAARGARRAGPPGVYPTPARYGLWQLTADQLAAHGHPPAAGYQPDIAAAVMAAETDQGTRWSAWSIHLRKVNRGHIADQVDQHLGGCAHDPAIADRAACRPDAGPIAHRAISFALTELGTPYSQCHSDWPTCGAGGRFGHPSGGGGHYDCSGLVHRAWHEAGYDLGQHNTTLRLVHATAPGGPLAHLAVADRYDPDVLRPGDALVWNNDGVGHMGIWLDGNQVLHASSSRGVVIDDISDWWISRTQRILRAPGGG